MFEHVNFNSNIKGKMLGTERTGQYLVIMATSLGQVGWRMSRGRVRVEPFNAEAAALMAPAFGLPAWKQPGDGGQPRFSLVSMTGEPGVRAAVKTAMQALLQNGASPQFFASTPGWARAMVVELQAVKPAATPEPEAAPGTTTTPEAASEADADKPTEEQLASARTFLKEQNGAEPSEEAVFHLAMARRSMKEAVTVETEEQEKARLLGEAKALGLRGASSRWKLETLRTKVAQATAQKSRLPVILA